MTARDDQNGPASVAVVGGGLAGLAAAVALGERGLHVELFEARRRLGGRAGSFRDPVSGELVDYCQHVAMACCTNLADFARRTGTSDCFRRQSRLHFIGPEGAAYRFAAAPLLPAPLHLVPGLLRLKYLRLADRLRILRTMSRLAKLPSGGGEDRTTIGSWLRSQGESDESIRHFWSVVLVSALSETLDRASLPAARKVIVDGFLASRRAYELEVPQVPLDEIYNRRVAHWLTGRGVTIHRGTRIGKIEGDAHQARALVLADGSRRPFDLFVAAVPWRRILALLPEAMLQALAGLGDVERIEPAPITAVHLWFDRPITQLTDAVLVGRLGQWVFGGSARKRDKWQVASEDLKHSPLPTRHSPLEKQQGTGAAGQSQGSEKTDMGHYYQVVVSASHGLAGRHRQDVARQVTEELAAIWPAARRARLLRWRVITHRAAVFSVRPGIEQFRPPQQTPIPNLALAGDWTATGWPATMEGAVRSGYLAAEAILKQVFPGDENRILVADLPPGRLARRLIRTSAD